MMRSCLLFYFFRVKKPDYKIKRGAKNLLECGSKAKAQFEKVKSTASAFIKGIKHESAKISKPRFAIASGF